MTEIKKAENDQKFKIESFKSAKFEPRLKTISVPELADFFPENENAEFVVRNLTSKELALCSQDDNRNQLLETVIKLLNNNAGKKEVDTVLQTVFNLLGITVDDTDIPVDLRHEHAIVFHGLHTPKLDYEIVVKLAQNFPYVFKRCYNEIMNLSAMGNAVKKKR